MIRIIVCNEDYQSARESDRYDRLDVVPNFFTKECDEEKDLLYLVVSARDAFDEGLDTIVKLQREFLSYLGKLTQKVTVHEVLMTMEGLVEFQEDIKYIHEKLRTIIVHNDLSLECEHYRFRHIDQLRAWRRESRDRREIKHPMYYHEDVERFLGQDLVLTFSKKQLKKLEELRREEEQHYNTVYLTEVGAGYALQMYGLREPLFEPIVKKATVKYNTYDEQTGQPKTVNLTFVERIGISRSTEGEVSVSAKSEHLREMEIPDEIVRWKDIGFETFVCNMFTLPTIAAYLREQGLDVIGEEVLYPEYEPLSFPVKNPEDHEDYIKWGFQDEAMDAWVNAGNLGTVALPTGSGKTMIGFRAIHKLKLQTTIVAPTIELLRQWRDGLIKWCGIPEEKIGLYYGASKEVKEITIITFQSGHRRVRKEVGKLEQTGQDFITEATKIIERTAVLIEDEGHHSAAPIFQEIMTNTKCRYRLSLTASPYREDKNEVLAFLAMGDVVYTKDYASLAEVKAVSPIRFKRVECKLTRKEHDLVEYKTALMLGEFRRRYGSWRRGGHREQKPTEEQAEILLLNWWNTTKWIDLQIQMEGMVQKFDEETGEPLIILDGNLRNIRGGYLTGFSRIKFAALKMVLDRHPDSKILIFNEFVKGSSVIQFFIEKECNRQAQVITGSTVWKERRRLFEEFRSSDTYILSTTTVLDEGIDVPDCDVVVIFNATRTPRQMIQRVGRGCRYAPGKVEFVYELVAVPENVNYTPPNIRKEKGIRETKDDRIIDRLHNMARYGSIGGKYMWRMNTSDVAERQFLLYDLEKSLYRDITTLINVEKQKELIAAVLPEDHWIYQKEDVEEEMK